MQSDCDVEIVLETTGLEASLCWVGPGIVLAQVPSSLLTGEEAEKGR